MQSRSSFAAIVRSVLLLGAGLSLAGCDVVVGSLHARAQAEQGWERSYDLSQGGTLEILNGNGRITVNGGDVARVEVKAVVRARAQTDESAREYLGKIEIREQTPADGKGIRLETAAPRLTGAHAEVEYNVTVPSWAALRLRNTNGQVFVRGVSGPVKAETTNGGVKGEALRGDIDASTTNGGVVLEVEQLGEQGIRAETTNGGVQVSIPADAKADVTASCVNGGVTVSGLQLQDEEKSRRRVSGKLNGGGSAQIVLETTNGGVKLTGK
jgi:hypothetical protein